MTTSLKEFQKKINDYIGKYSDGYWSPYVMLAALMEEVGELSREINHLKGYKPKKDSEDKKEIKIEIGDILFSIICLANEFKIDLSDALESTLDKYNKRDINRWHQK